MKENPFKPEPVLHKSEVHKQTCTPLSDWHSLRKVPGTPHARIEFPLTRAFMHVLIAPNGLVHFVFIFSVISSHNSPLLHV